jgi:hypothetical protein
MKKKAILLVVIAVFFLGCGSDDVIVDTNDAITYCHERDGVIEQVTNDNGEIEQICVYKETITYDIGEQTYTYRCEINALYEDRCDENADGEPEFYSDYTPLTDTIKQGNTTIGELFYQKVHDILSNLDNTGYAHNKNSNFSLIPSVKDINNEDNKSYNLFLDCSGFVGYYVVQGLNKTLYDKVSRSYMCGSSTTARPLAADFADTFLKAPLIDANATEAEQSAPSDETDVCWGRVDHISHARRGDILVYYHEEHIVRQELKCCYEDNNGSYVKEKTCSAEQCSEKYNSRLNYTVNGNSGHILFILDKPKLATNALDYCEKPEWIVHIADSTTSHHSFDTRKLGKDDSKYYDNRYQAWSKGSDDGYVQRCKDGSYQRSCLLHGTTKVETIYINTGYKSHPTGIGAGVIYVNDKMDGYRSKHSAEIDYAAVIIGRPITCK